MKATLCALALLLCGCASNDGARQGARDSPRGANLASRSAVESCSAEVERLSALLAAETAERRRQARAATRREEALRSQLEAMKSIERGILERERVRSESR